MTLTHDIDCNVCTAWLDAYVDGELDTATAALVNAHAGTCATCAKRLDATVRFKETLRQRAPRFVPPADLAAKIRTDIAAEADAGRTRGAAAPPVSVRAPVRPRAGWLGWLTSGGIGAGLAVGLALYVMPGVTTVAAFDDEIVSSHVRSLQVAHLVDVPSSDHHTVKPWFTGKIDFSPPVTDFAAQGFTLVGGRLDYLGHRDVAALSYVHGQHIINIYIEPWTGADIPPTSKSLRGFTLVAWAQAGMRFHAVSDAATNELLRLAELMRAVP